MDFERMLGYCAALELHNERGWFHENHKWYEGAKDDFTALVEDIKYTIVDHCDAALAEQLVFAQPKAMLYRVPRDVRVHRNAPPYNPSFRAYFSPDKRALLPVSYYLSIQPGGRSHFGTGLWTGGDRERLFEAREYLRDHLDAFEDALEASGCELFNGPDSRLKNVPRGFDPEDPAAEYLKYKEWYILRSFPDAELRDFGSFCGLVAETVERMEPFRRFSAAALSGGLIPRWS